MTIHAIPTTYNGITFRSRTEARWAVFFDALGINWEYEPEAFQLHNRGYLPDFRLNHPHAISNVAQRQCAYVEVKRPDGFGKEEVECLLEFSHIEQCAVLCLDGPPDLLFPRMRTFAFCQDFPTDSSGGSVWFHEVWWNVCSVCGLLRVFNVRDCSKPMSTCEHWMTSQELIDSESQRLRDALQTVRGYRFWNPGRAA